MRVLRHVLAIVALPGTVMVLIPLGIAHANATTWAWPDSPMAWLSAAAALIALTIGATLFASSLRRFDRDGDGTLAPWDAPKTLVVRGPYAYVRNPMISGVILLLVAEGLGLRSGPHLIWAGLFFAINAAYIPLLEEPMLRRRFAIDYEQYRANVPRLIPRVTPWESGAHRR